MDKECVILCEAINKIKGIRTVESCCGHGETPYHIWFTAERLDCLPNLLYWFAGCHCGYSGWAIKATTDCAKSPVIFCIEGPEGEIAYEQSKEIAKFIVNDLE